MTLTYIRPDADDTDGNWTNESDVNTNLYQSIDETSFSDTDYIKSGHLPDHDICKIRLSDPAFITMRPATVHYRFKKRGETTQQINLDVSLLQGATEIAKWTETDIATSYVDGSQALTLAQFNSITDFTNLYLQFDASSSWWLAASEVDLWFEDNLYHLSTALSSAHLLLHCDGADASTTFIDATGRHQVTRSGSGTEIDTAQSKFGGASAVFTTSSNYLNLDGSSDFAFGTGDYTIDMWARFAANNIGNVVYLYRSHAGGGGLIGATIFKWTDNKIYFSKNFGSTNDIIGATALSADIWYHIAITRSGTSTKLFINGTQDGSTYTGSDNLVVTADYPLIGGPDTLAGGWMDEIRILKGTAAWTTTFTPPTAPYNVALSGPYAHLSCSRASIGYATTSSGTLTSFASNALRITDLGLLVEDARENICLQSADFSTTWSPNGTISVTVNQGVAPDGTTTMDDVDDVAGGPSRHNVALNPGITANSTYTFSVFSKNVDRRYIQLLVQGGSTAGGIYCYADLQSGTISDSGVADAGTGTTFTAATIESFTNSIYRVSVTGKVNSADTTAYFQVSLSDRATQAGGSLDSFAPSYTGSNKSVLLWGAQVELGSFPSSYIATTGGSQTRAADAITSIGNLTASVAGTTATVVVDNIQNGGPANDAQILNETSSTGGTLVGNNGNSVTTWISGGGANLIASYGNSLTGFTGAKYGVGWSSSPEARSIVAGGGTVASDAHSFLNLTAIYLGVTNFGYVRRLSSWNTKLADADLQTMTDPAHTINFTTDEAAIDLDFVNAAYNAIALPTDFLIISRASVGYAQTLAGTLQLFGANQLRITDKGLLVEDARQNVIVQSQDFSTSWPTDQSSVTINQATAPDGTLTMDQIFDGVVGSGRHAIYQQIPTTGGATVVISFSIFAKDVDRRYVQLIPQSGSGDSIYAYFDLQAGTVTNSGSVGSGSLTSASIESFTGGVYRLTIVGHANSATPYILIALSDRSTQGGSLNFDSPSYAGTNKSVYLWGAQVELGAFPSSYVATTGGSQTRAADSITIIGSAGTIIAADSDQSIVVDATMAYAPANLAVADWKMVYSSTDNTSRLAINGNNLVATGGFQATAGSGTWTAGAKGGFSMNASPGSSLVMNGGAVATNSGHETCTIPKLGPAANGGFYGIFRRVTIWSTKLADATLQGFTNP